MPTRIDFNNKNQLSNILKKADTIEGHVIIDEENKTINGKFGATMKGGFMANDGFTEKQLEQLGLLIKPINERLTNIENRLENVENRLDVLEQDMKNVKTDIKAIKNCPTIKNEIKED